MELKRFGRVVAVAVAAATGVTLFSGWAQAQEWPKAKPVTIVSPWPASGGTFQGLAQILADRLQKKYGQTFVVENRAGASGSIGAGYVSRQPADGYTLMITTPGPVPNNKNTFPNLTYDPLKDFTFISRLYEQALIMVAHPKFGPNNLKELLDYAKKNPGKVNAGHPGVGTYGHMAELSFSDQAGIQMNLVPYKGDAGILPDLLGGQIDVAMSLIGGYTDAIRSGKLKLIGIAAKKREPSFPNVPTFIEQGVNFDGSAWIGFMGPAGMPQPLVDKINKDLAEIMTKDPEVAKLIEAGSATVSVSTPDEFKKIVFEEEAKWRPTIQKYEIRSQ